MRKPRKYSDEVPVRVVNLSTEEEYTFMPDYDPVLAVCYCFYTNNQQSNWFFEKLHDGGEDWTKHVHFGKHSVAKGDWCALLRDKHQ